MHIQLCNFNYRSTKYRFKRVLTIFLPVVFASIADCCYPQQNGTGEQLCLLSNCEHISRAVACDTQVLFVLVGPPGSGKTTTANE